MFTVLIIWAILLVVSILAIVVVKGAPYKDGDMCGVGSDVDPYAHSFEYWQHGTCRYCGLTRTEALLRGNDDA
jgi:hypothetical protein